MLIDIIALYRDKYIQTAIFSIGAGMAKAKRENPKKAYFPNTGSHLPAMQASIVFNITPFPYTFNVFI